MTLSRAYGVKLWTFWQNLSQLRRAYPSSWETLIDNAAVLQLFGIGNERIRREYAALAGLEPRDLARFQGTEQLLVVRGEARRCWLPNYLRDPAYAGKAAPNPFYQGARERGI